MYKSQSLDSKSRARTGTINLHHGPINTPCFMPVGTNGSVKGMKHGTLEDMGVEIILANTYHLYLRPGIEVIKRLGGLHKFSNWKKNILTDSGGYQVFSLAPFRKILEEGVKFRSHIDGSYHLLTPESVVDLQTAFGSDILMPLDVCTGPDLTEKKALGALIQTTKWLERTKNHWTIQVDKGSKGQLFGIVQGNFFNNLRLQSLEDTLRINTPGIAIGGLSVGEPFEVYQAMLDNLAPNLPSEKPRYVMGIGTPDFILSAVEAGIDIFDCVYPTRVARNGSVLTKRGLVDLKKSIHEMSTDPIEIGCQCTACTYYSKAYIRHMFKTNEMLGPMLATEHNIQFMHNFLKEIRNSIDNDMFIEYKNKFITDFYNEYRE